MPERQARGGVLVAGGGFAGYAEVEALAELSGLGHPHRLGE